MSGWYKRQRSIPERPWFKDGAVLQVYDYLESAAYVADGRYRGTVIRQGSCPTTRSEIIEVTGLSYKTVDRCLKKLVAAGDIIVKGNSQFSVITICGYGCYNTPESLFGTSEYISGDTSEDISGDTTRDTTHLSYIEERYKDNLISPYSPYKKERERGDIALEVKKRYNKTFDGKLPPCIRLTMPTRLMVEDCVRKFSMASVDMVFSQVLEEPFLLGQGKTGFIANFQYLFQPKNFQQILERHQLSKKKPQPQQGVGVIHVAEEGQAEKLQDDYEQQMREYAAAHPDSRPAHIVSQWDKNKNNKH